MGLFDKLFKKQTTPTFEKVQEEILTLQNQDRKIENPTRTDLDTYLNDMFVGVNEFVILTHAKAKNGVRYVQACLAGTKWIVQLGIEEGNATRLVEKSCFTSKECVDIFYLFYEFGTVENLEEYVPVQF